MGRRFVFNPFTGQLDAIAGAQAAINVEVALKIAEDFNCVEPAAVGDLVVASETLPDTVEPISSNIYSNVVFGVIIEKSGTGRARVLISGKLDGSEYQLSGLSTGKALYVGTNGKITTVVPATGSIQRMGVALKSSSIYLNISLDKVVR